MRSKNTYAGADSFTKKAKAEGYPARSIYKLEEIDRRVHLLRGGMNVLDLGAAPGSWTLYAAGKVGAGGRVTAIDLKEISVSLPPHVRTMVGDMTEMSEGTLAEFGPYDVVLSDMAPSTTGIPWADQAKSYELFMRALGVAEKTCKPGGAFVGKIFMGEELPEARKELRRLFEKEKIIRPEGTRSVSSEIFLVGTGRRSV